MFPVGMQPVQIPVQSLVLKCGEVLLQDISQCRASNPIRHCMFRSRTDQTFNVITSVNVHLRSESPASRKIDRLKSNRIRLFSALSPENLVNAEPAAKVSPNTCAKGAALSAAHR